MTDVTGPTFTQVQAQSVWTNYIAKVEGLCSVLEHRQQADILAEIKVHLLESYIRLMSVTKSPA